MRYILITIVGFFTTLFASGQTAGNGEKIMTEIAELYNKEVYDEMYPLHAPEFKSKITQDQLSAFYETNIRLKYGKIISWDPDKGKAGTINYRVQLENGQLDLSFSLNEKNEISGIQWLPHHEKKNIKKRDISNINYDNPKQTKLQLLIDSLALDHLQDSVNCGLSIGVIHNGKTEMFFYGSNYKDADVLPGMRTLYEIGSVTKTFTSILLAHAINEGKIKPEDDIRKYLPGTYPNLQFRKRPIQIKDLANHTSGLPRLPANLTKQPHYDPKDPYKNFSKEMIYSYLKKVKIDTFPGKINEYSNLGAAVLGIILENVYQKPLEELIKQYVTRPAKMKDTKFTLSEGERNKMATGYDDAGAETPYWNLGAFIAAGGLKSNMEDMLNYLAANMSETNPDFKLSHQQTFKNATTTVGLNWILTTTKNGNTLIWHNGGTAGFTSFCGYIKKKKIGLVVLNNSGVNVDNIAINILKGMNQ